MEQIIEEVEEEEKKEEEADGESSNKKSSSEENANLPPSVFHLEKPAGGFSSRFPKMMKEEKRYGRALLNHMRENR